MQRKNAILLIPIALLLILNGCGNLDLLQALYADSLIIAEPEKHLVDISNDELDGLAVGDLDGDGDADIAAGADGIGEADLKWFENNDGVGTDWVKTDLGDPQLNRAEILDFDDDGDNDIVMAGDMGGSGSSLQWYENVVGDGSSWSSNDIGFAGGDKDLSVVDVDNDGELNLVSVGWGSDKLYWFDYNGANWDDIPISADSFGWVKSVSTAHMDSDGLLDVVAMGYGGIKWWKNPDGTGTWTETDVAADYISFWDLIYSVDTADLDGDGDVDVISATPGAESEYDGELVWWENADGAGGSWTRHAIDSTVPGALISAGDIDGDGDFDIIGAGTVYDYTEDPIVSEYGYFTWWRNVSGDASEWMVHPIDTDDVYHYPKDATLADVDGDGDLDLAAVVTTEDGSPGGYVAWWELIR